MSESYEGRGDYARKINHAYRQSDHQFLFLAADDLCFCPNWFERAKARLRPGIGVVGTNDLGNVRVIQGRHATHSLVTREYADRGTIDQAETIYHEGYAHNFVDDELVATAKRRRAWVFARDSMVEHLHPDYGKAAFDDVYDLGRSLFRQDAALFRSRSARWRLR